MRQRLSSEPDRYRGRRRVPTPPRSRYAAVVTSAFVGAGIVALGASSMTDAKTVTPAELADLKKASITADDIAARIDSGDRASRDNDRAAAPAAPPAAAAEPWRLPLEGYSFTSAFGVRWDKMHDGIDLSAKEGTPYRAVHGGVVKEAKWLGGYGYGVIVDHGDGIETIYGHSSRLMVRQGQQVKAGDVLGEVGSTGHSYAPHLHLEMHVNGTAQDPVTLLMAHGVDIKLQFEAPYSGVAAGS